METHRDMHPAHPNLRWRNQNPNKTESKAIIDILDSTIKRVLMVPRTTPRKAIYIETGLMDVEHAYHHEKQNQHGQRLQP